MTRALLLALLVAIGSRLVPALLDALPHLERGAMVSFAVVACGAALALDALARPRP